jgi:two-component system OmpR family response regulator
MIWPEMNSRTPHILIVDDDREIRRLVARFLTENGLRVTAAADGTEADAALAAGRFDLVVLDLMLPGEDGISIARRLRRDGDLPILMLTARGTETDRIVGLEIGADDYVTKPFSPRELLARIRAVLRRTGERVPEAPKAPVFRFAGWAVDVQRRELRRPDGALVPTTDAEFDLLAAFVERPQRVLSREQLLDLARGRQAQLFDRSIDVAVMRLRRKIEPDPTRPEIIRTVRNGGYMFALDVETAS